MDYGLTADEWRTAKAEITEILRRTAAARGMITYSDLSSQLTRVQIGYREPAMGALLGEISTEEAQAGRGMLSVIVVHKYGDMEPGLGFFEQAEWLGVDVSDRTACWVDQLHKAHDAWSNRKT